MLPVIITLPRHPTGWVSVAQELGEHLKCDPPDFLPRYASPVCGKASWGIKRLSRPQGHSAIGRIMSMKNSNDTIWNRTSDLPICNTAP